MKARDYLFFDLLALAAMAVAMYWSWGGPSYRVAYETFTATTHVASSGPGPASVQ